MPGVYISYPFCAQKCTYCNFASGVLPRAWEPRYVDALIAEIGRAAWLWTPETVYLGGGTPSQMDPDALDRVLAAIPGRPWQEATLEAAPGTFDAAQARRWRAAGIGRVSLGVQSFVEQELRRTGRRHTAAVAAANVATLRQAGIEDINIDLIAGLAGQTPQNWTESLDWIARLAPTHVSVYMLEIDEDSRLGQEILLGGQRYGAPDVPSDERIVEFYETAVERLAALGLARYEISNFAAAGRESRHNLKYWRMEPYLGFGADAHSFDGTFRWQNVETVQQYLDRGSRVEAARVEARPEEERLFTGLRLAEGVPLGRSDWGPHAPAIERFLDLGLLLYENGRLRLTSRGILLSNEVFAEFLSA